MLEIKSKINTKKTLHLVFRYSESDNERFDIVNPEQFIQCSMIKPTKGKKFKPHRHIWKSGPTNVIAQESWVVINGSVRVYFYDLDDSLLDTVILHKGDASFTFEGGHTYEILEDNTYIYEYKTGPYTGIENDKIFL